MSKKPWRFEPEDFLGSRGQYAIFDIAEKANAKLDEWMKGAMVIYSGDGSDQWSPFKTDIENVTHRALLINIEELPKEPCKHEALVTGRGTLGWRADCIHCGVKLKATWEAVE